MAVIDNTEIQDEVTVGEAVVVEGDVAGEDRMAAVILHFSNYFFDMGTHTQSDKQTDYQIMIDDYHKTT